ncbi:hypothetical protein [Gloeobacter morelensis]|uniref:hypothetical protein n=1 Tax=Gloeobacter morelensis TaxID=2907343 RepID=UPI001E48E84A|nr:hypothetical protein [Gloeobacter morelensis]
MLADLLTSVEELRASLVRIHKERLAELSEGVQRLGKAQEVSSAQTESSIEKLTPLLDIPDWVKQTAELLGRLENSQTVQTEKLISHSDLLLTVRTSLKGVAEMIGAFDQRQAQSDLVLKLIGQQRQNELVNLLAAMNRLSDEHKRLATEIEMRQTQQSLDQAIGEWSDLQRKVTESMQKSFEGSLEDWTEKLGKQVKANQDQGEANRKVIEASIAKWSEQVTKQLAITREYLDQPIADLAAQVEEQKSVGRTLKWIFNPWAVGGVMALQTAAIVGLIWYMAVLPMQKQQQTLSNSVVRVEKAVASLRRR